MFSRKKDSPGRTSSPQNSQRLQNGMAGGADNQGRSATAAATKKTSSFNSPSQNEDPSETINLPVRSTAPPTKQSLPTSKQGATRQPSQRQTAPLAGKSPHGRSPAPASSASQGQTVPLAARHSSSTTNQAHARKPPAHPNTHSSASSSLPPSQYNDAVRAGMIREGQLKGEIQRQKGKVDKLNHQQHVVKRISADVLDDPVLAESLEQEQKQLKTLNKQYAALSPQTKQRSRNHK